MIRTSYNGISKNISKVYAEHNGVSTEVVCAYAEVNGVSELVYSSTPILPFNQYRKTADELSVARCYIGSGSTADYAFMVCGADSNNAGTDNVDAYDYNGIKTVAPDSWEKQARTVCVQNGKKKNPDLLLLSGATTGSSTIPVSYPEYYNNSLVRGTITSTAINEYVISSAFYLNEKSYLGGGRNGSSYNRGCVCYSSNKRASTLSPLSTARGYSGAAATDAFGAIIGGYNGTRLTDIDIYNTSNVHSTLNLSIGRQYPLTARLGDGIIVAGGMIDMNNGTSSTNSIEYISKDKVITVVGQLHNAPSLGCCASNGKLVGFIVGANYNNGNVRTKDTEYIDSNFIVSLATPTRDEHFAGGASILGNRVFVGGGSATGGTRVSSVEIYDIFRR